MALVETTTIRVSRKTLESLERLREKLDAGNLDEAIQALIRRQRRMVVEGAFGVDKGKIRSFSEEDRGEDRS
jgi:DNA-binding MurR/RpiR family transcriptional regulator